MVSALSPPNLIVQEVVVKYNQSSCETGPSSSISSETVKNAAICGLSAAATKSKLFADQEEREIQRLSATIINHQVCCNKKFADSAV
jgi:hypothetical protein